ncbi:MAG: radical SAM protein [Bacteroidetes bacterium]|nr:radical SAM protein [Bacteroidota bacterium]
MIIFGPVPSRRLGRSLGVNSIPPKVCSYSCIYCQVGATDSMSIKRKEFFSSDQIYYEVAEKVRQLNKVGEKIDNITFVPDGEPTLDINIGNTIEKLKSFGIKIAVITNASLIWDIQVQKDLMKADWVSLKIDSVIENIWRKINRPHGLLDLQKILHGIEEFAASFRGILVTETMLVKGVNDNRESLSKTAQMIKGIKPESSYILVPTRPTVEKTADVPSEENINMAYQIFSGLINNVQLVVSNEGTDFHFSSDAEKELLSILAVHPMRKDAVEEFLFRSNSDWNLIDKLIKHGQLKEVTFSGNNFFIKNISR